ncbi:MAG: urease subunit beta [Muribaculaceae bacterium]|nr:urease subunit beta [Muribaculaceae bacterium]MDE6540967.1 urease subunit beta [Muribaculaceae bacterium]
MSANSKNINPGFKPSADVPVGGVVLADGNLEYNAGRQVFTITVRNTGDRPIQVGSHLHFFEANRYLEFDRKQAFGCHLNIPATTAIRFEPGEQKDVEVVAFGGKRRIIGFNGLTDGYAGPEDTPSYFPVRDRAYRRMLNRGFMDTPGDTAEADYVVPGEGEPAAARAAAKTKAASAKPTANDKK